jgi:hypothetical protein
MPRKSNGVFPVGIAKHIEEFLYKYLDTQKWAFGGCKKSGDAWVTDLQIFPSNPKANPEFKSSRKSRVNLRYPRTRNKTKSTYVLNISTD